jgi:anti-sigma B factor antagonist
MRDAAAGRLNVTIERAEGAVVVRAEGEVDLESAESLAASLRAAGEGAGPVIVDMIGVPFMDSSGLRTLLVAVTELGERLALVVSPGSPVAHLLEIVQVRDRFEVHATVEDALRARTDG